MSSILLQHDTETTQYRQKPVLRSYFFVCCFEFDPKMTPKVRDLCAMEIYGDYLKYKYC